MQREYQENLEKEPDVTQFHLDSSLYDQLTLKVISKFSHTSLFQIVMNYRTLKLKLTFANNKAADYTVYLA